MASTIKIKRSGVSGKQPNTASLSVGELAINYKDQKLYSSNGTSVFEIGSSSGGLVTTTTKAFGSLKGTDTVITGVTAAVSTNYLQVANAVATYATKASPTTSGLLAHTGRATISTNLAVSGNVGIGTSSPAGRLHARFDAGAADGYTGKYIFQTTDQRLTLGTYWQSGVGQYARIQASNDTGTVNTPLLLNPDGGNVGIGTSSPDRRLKIEGAGASFGIDAGSGALAIDPVGGGFAQIDVSGANALRFNTNSAERMRIDSAGRVTMPYQTAFYAYGSGTQSWFGAAGAFPVQLASSASSGSRNAAVYNTSTYRFTAPVAGLYYFYAQYTPSTTTSTGPESLLYINGSTDQYGSINYTNIAYTTSSTSWIRYMNANDYAEFRINNNNSTSFTIDLARSRFIGFLLG